MKLAWALSVGVSLAGCGGKAAPPPAPPANTTPAAAPPAPAPVEPDVATKALAQLGAFADQMCACHDTTCADRVQNRMNAWATAMAEKADPKERNRRASEADMKQMNELGTRYGECMAKAMQAAP